MDLSTHRVSPMKLMPVFGVCLGVVSLDSPLAETVLYPQHDLHKALPK